MNKFNALLKVISALVAVVGAVYIIATYGDKIVAWAKKLIGSKNPIATFHFSAPIQRDETATEEAATDAEDTSVPHDEEVTSIQVEEVENEEVPQESAQPLTANDEDFAG